ncbi:hypothetical protein NO1_1674 [Candidatus Termititenax aidoneus]|uniref:Uncharacterized protein n=1 Tax=Termititenax aidoneus TaxID=2218524 RepID=A0A388TD93_TERA1|nr:hypothetical protein NO1_1674 [Candidatus Termititenax aidoneus]
MIGYDDAQTQFFGVLDLLVIADAAVHGYNYFCAVLLNFLHGGFVQAVTFGEAMRYIVVQFDRAEFLQGDIQQRRTGHAVDIVITVNGDFFLQILQQISRGRGDIGYLFQRREVLQRGIEKSLYLRRRADFPVAQNRGDHFGAAARRGLFGRPYPFLIEQRKFRQGLSSD